MLHILTQYGPTVLIIAALVALFAFLAIGMIRDKRKGKSCCGGCAGCANACHCHPQGQEKKEDTTASAEGTSEN